MVDTARISETLGKMKHYLENHESVCCGVSGGSDSNIIVHIIATYFREYLPKIHFVFEDTGLEYKATKRHLKYIEDRYQIEIERVRGEPIPLVVKREGMPILSKNFSHTVLYAGKDREWATKQVYGQVQEKTRFKMSKNQQALAQHILDNNIKVSDLCCVLSKKKPYENFVKKYKCDLIISGERQAEGGCELWSTLLVLKQAQSMTDTCPFSFGMTKLNNITKSLKILSILTVMKFME